jgi:hypothetical protein
MRVAVAIGCGLLVLALAMVVVGVLVWRGSGSSSPLTADPALQALVAPRLADVEGLAAAVVPTCPAHRSGTAPSPALGTPIVSWPETRGVQVQCMFESPPGSGSATGGGFEDWGVTDVPNGAYAEYGRSGWHLDACRMPGHEDCVDYSYAEADPSFVQIEAYRRFPTGDGWVRVAVMMHR